MQINFFTQNIKLSGELQDFLEEKIQKLSRFSDKINQARVDLSYNPKHDSDKRIRLEVSLSLPKKILYSQVRAGDLQEAVDLIEKKLRKQLETYREHRKIKRRITSYLIRQRKEIEE